MNKDVPVYGNVGVGKQALYHSVAAVMSANALDDMTFTNASISAGIDENIDYKDILADMSEKLGERIDVTEILKECEFTLFDGYYEKDFIDVYDSKTGMMYTQIWPNAGRLRSSADWDHILWDETRSENPNIHIRPSLFHPGDVSTPHIMHPNLYAKVHSDPEGYRPELERLAEDREELYERRERERDRMIPNASLVGVSGPEYIPHRSNNTNRPAINDRKWGARIKATEKRVAKWRAKKKAAKKARRRNK